MLVAGLAVAGWGVNRALRGTLVDRVDRDLARMQGHALDQLTGDAPTGETGRITPGLPDGAVAQLRTADGTVLQAVEVRSDGDALVLPATVPAGRSSADLSGSPGEYRILSAPAAGVGRSRDATGSVPAGAVLVVAMPLGDVNATMRHLVEIELAVGAVVLAGIGLLGGWMVRVGLRPLARIQQTTGSIVAGGDLSRRVTDEDPRTEVGRLAGGINRMLDRIEGAFADQRASEERLRRFVADASHELQTPLTSVRGYAELFRRGAARDPELARTSMARIEAEATRMGGLVDDLLMLARLDQGRAPVREPVDLGALVGDLVRDARVVEPDRPIDLRTDPEVVVAGDDAALRQVTANLLANVRAHTPAGTPVHVSVTRRDGGACLEVRDEGPGLSAEDAARVFDRFYRADPSRARASGGSGLGLSIVAAVAAAHDGLARVESAPRRGAAFTVVLPLAVPPPHAGPVPAPLPATHG
ncbi:MAG: HAMP domain-containing histidine kinase [Thermoleophilia bacterium]|nr:HAMP domain-containing histidine kinase [Thermoleophilia bacterium]